MLRQILIYHKNEPKNLSRLTHIDLNMNFSVCSSLYKMRCNICLNHLYLIKSLEKRLIWVIQSQNTPE